jgi:hypothetical protein
MNGIRRIAIGMAVALGTLALGPGISNAGDFTMKQCDGALHLDFQASYAAINGSDNFDVVAGCSTGGPGKIGVYQDRSGENLTFGDGGHFRWDAPVGIGVIATQFAARLRNASSLTAELNGWNDGSTDLDGGVAHDGDLHTTVWSDPTNPQTMISAKLGCAATHCENQPSSTKAFVEVTDAEFTVRDYSAPTVSASGKLWNWAADSLYHRSSAAIKVDATDQGSGIAGAWAEVNGLKVEFPAPDCPGDRGSYSTRFTPCHRSFSATRTLDTASAPFQEGDNLFRVCVRDYASTTAGAAAGCSPYRKLRVDNQPSNPPLLLHSDQGVGWQPDNGFTLRWQIPGGQVAPVIGAIYQIQETESGAVAASGYLPGSGTENANLAVPEVGEYTAFIALLDGAGNLGEASETILRFDDRPPGDVSPEPPAGWISRDELPLEQEIERAEAGGPSGISGYALAVSDQGPTAPCGTEICLAPEITISGGADARTGSVAGLSEGSHWVSAAAVSGAHRASLEPGSTVVQVDRTAPAVSISGVPSAWVNHPVSLTVQASDRLSGMQPKPGDDGQPVTVIAADGYAPYESPGPVATFAVATEGVNHIRYWAEDLAGNANDGLPGPGGETHPDPGRAVVRIDSDPPEFGFDPRRDSDEPELVRLSAEDADSGVSTAMIMIRRAGSSGVFQALATARKGDGFEARVPSDDLARGAYELRAKVVDRAGNEALGNQTLSGEPMILNLPLKQPVDLSAKLAKSGSSRKAGYNTRQFVEGRLTSGGTALPNQVIRVVEDFLAGSRRDSRSREVRTDGDGRYRLGLTSGPTRSVEVFFDGTPKLSRSTAPKLQLNVKGRVTFRIKPKKLINGGAVRMKGSVGFRGALPPARGKLVAIQFFDPGRRKWRPVEVLRTNRRGWFHYVYRFRTISSAQRIVFRASALPEAGWPYLPSTSKPRSVIVYPKG